MKFFPMWLAGWVCLGLAIISMIKFFMGMSATFDFLDRAMIWVAIAWSFLTEGVEFRKTRRSE